jgi:valyl-tRNA synthetase
MITEEIYQKLPGRDGRSIMIQAYPAADPARDSPDIEARFASLQEVVRAVRTIRSEFTIPPDRKIDFTIVSEDATRENFESHRALIAHLAGSKDPVFRQARPDQAGVIGAAGKGFEVFVVVKEAIDAPREIARLGKDREKTISEIQRTEAKLANASFVDRAPKEVVDREKEKLSELARRVGKIEEYVRALGG